MSIELQEKEFVALNPETINQLITEREREQRAWHGKTRRRIQRWPFPGTVQLWAQHATGEEFEVLGTCHNLNEHGIGVYCECPFRAGVEVPLAIHQPEATYHGKGVVRHCTPSGREYFIGIEFITEA